MSRMPQRVAAARVERSLRVLRTPRPQADPRGPRLPYASEVAYLPELRRRMHVAMADYAAAETRISQIRDWYASLEDGEHEVYMAMADDLEVKRLRSRRGNARERARTLALVILAEQGFS